MSVEPTSVEVPERPTVRRRLATKIDVQSLKQTKAHNEEVIENQCPQQTSATLEPPPSQKEAELTSYDLSRERSQVRK